MMRLLKKDNRWKVDQTDQNQQQMNDEADQEINQEIDGTQEQSELTENPDTPENTTGERTVVSVDENGNVFDVEEETDGVVKEDLSNKARAAATYIVNFRAECSRCFGLEIILQNTKNTVRTPQVTAMVERELMQHIWALKTEK